MIDIPEAEALAILQGPWTCEDPPPLELCKALPGTFRMSCGLLDADGKAPGLIVELVYRATRRTKRIYFKYTVFQLALGGQRRILQLQVAEVAYRAQNHHQLGHLHVGKARYDLPAGWENWTFEASLDYFCQRSNITFKPPLKHPEHFELDGR